MPTSPIFNPPGEATGEYTPPPYTPGNRPGDSTASLPPSSQPQDPTAPSSPPTGPTEPAPSNPEPSPGPSTPEPGPSTPGPSTPAPGDDDDDDDDNEYEDLASAIGGIFATIAGGSNEPAKPTVLVTPAGQTTGGNNTGLVLVILILAIAGGVFVWIRSRKKSRTAD